VAVSTFNIAALGAIAGFTIFLGLPVGRVRSLPTGMRALLNATATGVLLFLFWDVLVHAVEPVETALVAVTQDGTGTWRGFLSLASVFVAGLVLGLMTLAYYEQWMAGAKGTARPHGPGAASVAEFTEHRSFSTASPARQLALLIAVGIGLHNFSEGLAIGQSAAAGQLSLAIPLIVGFGLHNATEGFGIVAPLAGEPTRPTWGFLALLGLIAGGSMIYWFTGASTLAVVAGAYHTVEFIKKNIKLEGSDKASTEEVKVVAQSAPSENNSNPEPNTHDHADLRLQPDPTSGPQGTEPKPV
jgi:ZIP family zinc transporter